MERAPIPLFSSQLDEEQEEVSGEKKRRLLPRSQISVRGVWKSLFQIGPRLLNTIEKHNMIHAKFITRTHQCNAGGN